MSSHVYTYSTTNTDKCEPLYTKMNKKDGIFLKHRKIQIINIPYIGICFSVIKFTK